jgi:hypothetical protein
MYQRRSAAEWLALLDAHDERPESVALMTQKPKTILNNNNKHW